MNPYWKNRKDKTITERYGSYRLTIRYFEDSNKAQVSMENISISRFPLLWSYTMTDEQANAALSIFKSIGFFEIWEGLTA